MGTLSLVLGIISLLAGFVSLPLLLSSVGFLFALIPAIILITIGVLLIKKYDKDKKKPKPMCEFCEYIAIDERELHNHQITCEKKKLKEKN